MTKDELIQKWLKDELSPTELEAFKALDDYENLMKLSDGLMHFKAPEFDEKAAYHVITNAISEPQKTPHKWLKPILRIAALLALSFSIYYYTSKSDTSILANTTEKIALELPDHSQVTLNALSTLTYNENDWKTTRELTLEGEAFFKVSKGSQFKVQTAIGSVTVLGTEFLVEQRAGIFEVICYEGSVKVKTDTKESVLTPGEQFLLLDGELISTSKKEETEPAWLHDESSFENMPYKYVLQEFERQYQVKINTTHIKTNQLFTGRFTHNNLEMALKTITLPLNITYSKTNNEIVLQER
ncbi:FecR family protein [Bizionia sp. KMM 8389]